MCIIRLNSQFIEVNCPAVSLSTLIYIYTTDVLVLLGGTSHSLLPVKPSNLASLNTLGLLYNNYYGKLEFEIIVSLSLVLFLKLSLSVSLHSFNSL